jgi:hypothetical protein
MKCADNVIITIFFLRILLLFLFYYRCYVKFRDLCRSQRWCPQFTALPMKNEAAPPILHYRIV